MMSLLQSQRAITVAHRLHNILFLLFALCVGTGVLQAEDKKSVLGTTGKIAGTIIDATTGDPLIGATVRLEGTKFGARSDVEGNYTILNIPPGAYTVTASYVGYQPKSISGLKVSIDLTARADFKLSTTEVTTEEVVITAERPVVIKDMTATRAAVGSEEIQSLPIQNPSQVLELQGGAVGGTFRGGRRGEAMYIVDGFSVNDVYDGNQSRGVNNIGVEGQAIQELELLTGGYNAEYGQALSAVVNIVTKEGGSKLSGSFQSFLGGYATPRTETFQNVNNFARLGVRDFQGSLSGAIPGFGDELTFFLNARSYEDEGRFYGRNVYQAGDILPASIFTNNQIGGFIGILPGEFSNENFIDLIEQFRTRFPQTINPSGDSYFAVPINFNDFTEGIRVYEALRPSNDDFKPYATGNGDFVVMNPYRKFSGMSKLTWRPSGSFKVSGQLMVTDEKFQNFDFGRSLSPFGIPQNFRTSYTGIVNATHTLSSSTFYNIGVSYLYSKEQSYLYEDPLDQRYLMAGINDQTVGGSFSPGQAQFGLEFLLTGLGTDHFRRSTQTINIKGDISSQVDNNNLVKMGLDVKLHTLDLQRTPLFLDESSLFSGIPAIRRAELGEAGYDEYTRRPMEFAAYIQNKFEINNFIVNLGVRFDLFSPDGTVPIDPSDPSPYDPLRPENLPKDANGNIIPYTRNVLPIYVENGQRLLSDNFRSATVKWQFSPRLGVAFPITDKGILRFFYGHVFQIPNFEFLYRNPFFRRDPSAAISGPYGNADLKPQKTIKGEVGLQQQFGEDIGVDVALYFNDIRNLNGSAFLREYFDRGSYTQFVNTDYALVRGIVIGINKRLSQNFNLSLDYTFQIAQGNASDPASAAVALSSNSPLPTQLITLDWDQRHTFNVTGIFQIDGWEFSTIGRYGSGFPFTPDLNAPFEILTRGSRGEIVTNTLRRETTFTLDFRAQKNFKFGDTSFGVFFQVYNVLDAENQTGNYPFAQLTPDLILRNVSVESSINSSSQYLNQPQLFSAPRQILTGLSIFF
ncbi:MAG: TonB-dependent receptor [Chloroherpetonaceae bacterium]|nr:TonB-dependent receptor [Chloroherpetonaceae bacterium]